MRAAIGFTLAFLFSLSLSGIAVAQKVGVVLSGGAAKGLAHIGVLKALEENEVPVDYIVGTSMGGIVAGCYAAGMSPEQIEAMVLSDDFLRWVNGQPELGYNYFYNKPDDNGAFVRFNLSLDSTLSLNLNTAIASDLTLNFALAERLAQPSAIARNNFDSLFVPLRVVAADIFTQSQVILKTGLLSDALRATQTVPFFYNPIRIDGKFLFDGGVYNNFPVDVAQHEFNPDVIIGCNVSSKVYKEYPYGEDEKLISRSLLYMLLDKSDPAKVPANGIYIQPDLERYTAFDFARARSLIDSGYAQTMRQMAQIKSRLRPETARTCDDVAARRNKFNSRTQPLLIQELAYDGFSPRQQRYINRFFKGYEKPMTLRDTKAGYFNLMTTSFFQTIYPRILLTEKDQFALEFSRRPQNDFQVDFGGVIATRSISHIFLGLNYFYFSRTLTHGEANFYAGNFYKSALLKARINIPNAGQFFLEPQATFNDWDFLESRDVLFQRFNPTVLKRIDRKMGLAIGRPVGELYRASLYGFYLNNDDDFINPRTLVSTDTLDQLSLNGGRYGLSFSTNTLNRKQYANRGTSILFSIDRYDLNQRWLPGNTSEIRERLENQQEWWRIRLTVEQYFKRGFYSSGIYLDGVFSNQQPMANYFSTIANAPGFFPLQDSRTLLLRNFRAFNFVAGGWRNVFTLRKNLDFRLEGYLFKPFESIVESVNQKAVLDGNFTQVFFAGTGGWVLHSPVGPVSLSVNYYDDPDNRWNVLLHVGFLLFNKPSID
jgi:NTE family protein